MRERDSDVSAKAARNGEGKTTGDSGATLPPFTRHRASHGQTGADLLGFHDREKMASLATAYRNPEGTKSIAGQHLVSSLCPSTLGQQKVGAGFCPQKAFGLPHPWVGEINFAGQAGNGVTGALRTARGSTLGLSCISCIFRRAISRAESSIHKSANSGPNPTQNLWEGYKELCFSAKKTTQRPTGGHEGLSCFCRSFATRWRSVASSSLSICR